MLCCFLASDGIMLMYDLWRGALFYLQSGDMGRLFYLLCRSMGCLSCPPSLSACLRRSWWKHRATLSSLQTSIRRATCQMVRASESHGEGEGRVLVKQSLSLTNTSAASLLVELSDWQQSLSTHLQADFQDNAANTTGIQDLSQSSNYKNDCFKTWPDSTTQCSNYSHQIKGQSLLGCLFLFCKLVNSIYCHFID